MAKEPPQRFPQLAIIIAAVAITILPVPFLLAKLIGGKGGGETQRLREEEQKKRRPTSLAELQRVRQAEAADARRRQGLAFAGEGSRGPSGGAGIAKPTPYGQALAVARTVDSLLEAAQQLITKVDEGRALPPSVEKEIAGVEEQLTQAQLQLDGIQADESVRPIRKAQTRRIQLKLEELSALLERWKAGPPSA
eukprot:TRINITY_DN19820_c0_g1_i1.p1 TRINITY_DN19820_c0_g1~~TRINITY_DN19820_c0_g1_i1.p1  ORF type:complete len:194 (-),score=48.80 TRINITY_DN19820_c0_g1_i1:759-1340(-)